MTGRWYHRGPCTVHWCSICGSGGCYVWQHDDGGLDVHDLHICAAGCDGLPPSLLARAS